MSFYCLYGIFSTKDMRCTWNEYLHSFFCFQMILNFPQSNWSAVHNSDRSASEDGWENDFMTCKWNSQFLSMIQHFIWICVLQILWTYRSRFSSKLMLIWSSESWAEWLSDCIMLGVSAVAAQPQHHFNIIMRD